VIAALLLLLRATAPLKSLLALVSTMAPAPEIEKTQSQRQLLE